MVIFRFASGKKAEKSNITWSTQIKIKQKAFLSVKILYFKSVCSQQKCIK